MATREEQLDTMYTTTWQLRKAKVYDQVFAATPFYLQMTQKGRIEHRTGGRYIEEPLRIAKNNSVTSIGRGGTVDFEDTDPLTVSKWDWKHVTGHILRYYSDTQKNRGKAALIRKVNVDIDTLRDSTVSWFETALFADGTGNDGKDINGLGNIVAEIPTTDTVGGINRATESNSWWRNNVKDMTGETPSVRLISRMRSMWNTCGIYPGGGRRFPDLIITTQAIHEVYEDEALEIGKVMMPNKQMMDLGFGELAFKGAPIVWAPECTDESMFLLNTDHLRLVVDDISWFSMGKWLDIVNQPLDRVAHIMTTCNLVTSNSRKHGQIFDIVV